MRDSSRWMGWGIGLGGAGLFALSALTIRSFLATVASGAAIIEWDMRGWSLMPAAFALFALALALFIGRHDGQAVKGARSNAIRRLLILAVCLLPCSYVFAIGAHWIAGRHLEARGYTACGAAFWIAADRLPDRDAALARCEEWRRG